MCFKQLVDKRCCFPGFSSDPFVLKVVTAVHIRCSLISNSCYVSPGYRIEELQLLKILSRKKWVFQKKVEIHRPMLVSYLNVYCLKCIFLNQ